MKHNTILQVALVIVTFAGVAKLAAQDDPYVSSVDPVYSDRYASVNWQNPSNLTYDELNAYEQGECAVGSAFITSVNIDGGPAGTALMEFKPGFNETVTWQFYLFEDDTWVCAGSDNVELEGLRRPGNLTYTEGYGLTAIELRWDAETDWDDDDVEYRVFAPSYPAYFRTEDGAVGVAMEDLQIVLPGSHRSVVLYNLDPSQTEYYYSVSTYHPGYDKGSLKSNITASLPSMSASENEYVGRTKLEWSSMAAFADQMRIRRSLNNGWEEIAIVDKNATAYNDYEGIPGFIYTYSLEVLDASGDIIGTLYADGSSKPDGRISGQVVSREGVGVSGVEIEVAYTGTAPSGGPAPTCDPVYCTTTDADGFYEINNIYYKNGSEVQVTPVLGSNTFTPVARVRTLTQDNFEYLDVDFVDQTSFTVSGRILYGDGGPVEGATVLVNEQDLQIRSQADGSWATTFSEPGTFNFSVELYDHVYVDGNGFTTSSHMLQSGLTDLDFYNTTKRTLEVVAQGGCELSLGSAVVVQFTNSDTSFTTFLDSTDAAGKLLLTDLEPRNDYTLEVIDVLDANVLAANILDQFEPQSIDLEAPGTYEKIVINTDSTFIAEVTETLDDGTVQVLVPADTLFSTSADTIYESFPTVRFIYRSGIDFEIDFEQAGAEIFTCGDSRYDNVPIVDQLAEYDLEIEVFEDLGAGGRCPIDQGTMLIYDAVSDMPSTAVEVDIVNGLAYYTMIPGTISTDSSGNHPFQKSIIFYPAVDFLTGNSQTFYCLVEGLAEHEPTFVSGTPEIPQLVIHDPPGDNSYAYVEAGTSITTFNKSSVLTSDGGSTFDEMSIGFSGEKSLFSLGFSNDINVTVESSYNSSEESGYFTTLTFNETFSTSSLENYTHEDGDIYIGAAYNQSYAISPQVKFNEAGCKADVDEVLNMAIDGIATTFVYSELHIRNTLLPQLSAIMAAADLSTNDGRIEYYKRQADSTLWADILAANEANRNNPGTENEGNVSVSAGATYSRTYEVTSGINVTYGYGSYFSEEIVEKAGAEISLIVDFSAAEGGMAATQHTYSEVFDSTSQETRKIGYVIEDNDLGDFFSFDVYPDPDYDTPIFSSLTGTSSCPQEPGTQPRDKPAISVDKPRVDDIPIGGQGKFVLTVSNNSQSGESREYAVRVISATNPDGAYVALAGSGINFYAAPVFIAPGQSVDFVLTVDAGPVASTYENIEIMVYPPCEYELWQDGGVLRNADTISISAYFQSECSAISITDPTSDWIINQQSNDIVDLTIGGFDINNEKFESVAVWVQPEGAGYIQVDEIPVDQLTTPYSAIAVDLSAYEDGKYKIKVSADCDNGAERTYSNEVAGIIDRSSVAPFGVPSPSDGFLQFGEVISVTFDKDIDASSVADAEITLIRTDDSSAISFNANVVNDVVELVPSQDLTTIADLTGVVVSAHVHLLRDVSGNVQEYPVDWSFKVNASPVFWDPESVYYTTMEGMPFEFDMLLKNSSEVPKVFTLDPADDAIVSYPEWLEPLKKSGTTLQFGESTVGFKVDEALPPGIYSGIVTASVEGEPVSFDITIEQLAVRPTWGFDPTNYQYSCTYVLQFSLDDSDTNLSTDERDLIAAFVDGEVRGLTNIEYLPESGVYRAFLTVYSKIAGGGGAEEVTFRFWNALSGIEYMALETSQFQSDVRVGSVASPFILHPGGNFQVIPLKKGWNWISFNVQTADMSKENIFRSVLKTVDGNTITIKSRTNTAEYSPGSGWNGNLQNVNNVEGYLVHLSDEPDTLYVAGYPVATPTNVALGTGWIWLGYPGQTAVLVDTALQDLSPATGDILKSQVEFAEYVDNSSGWEGSLKSMQPGKGYKINLAGGGTITFRDPSLFEVSPEQWEYNMNITAVLDLDEQLYDVEDLQMGIFIDGVCRGFADVLPLSKGEGYRYMALAHGNAKDLGKPVVIRFRDARTGEVLNTADHGLEFAPDALNGNVSNPILLTLNPDQSAVPDDMLKINKIAPNPVTDVATIYFETSTVQSIDLELVDINGRIVWTHGEQDYPAGIHTAEINFGQLIPGIYVCRLATAGDVAVYKVVKQ